MANALEARLRDGYRFVVTWILIRGNRLHLTGGVVVGFFLVTWALSAAGILTVGPRSPIRSVLGSGAVAGLFSLISVTLAINQLISSRVFGPLDRLQGKLQGGVDLRDTVADIANHPSPPIRTVEFIAFIGDALQDQLEPLRAESDFRDDEIDEQLATYVKELNEYANNVQRVSSEMSPENVIATLAGPDFAHHFDRTDELRGLPYEHLTADERQSLDAIADLLGAVSVCRQYFKTIALHQELAQLSRHFILVGFPAVTVAILVPLLYRTSPPDVLTSYPLPVIISASLAVVITPLILLMAYMLRIATIFRYTVSVAPFVPPVEWTWSDEFE